MTQIGSGLGTGLDINGLVQQLLAAEAQPVTLRLDKQEAKLQSRLSAIGSFKGAMAGFQDSLEALSSPDNYRTYAALSSNRDVLSASAGDGARPGKYDVEIFEVARSHSLASASFVDSLEPVGNGKLTISFGDYDGISFSLNAEKQSYTIDISDSNNTLLGIRDAINEASTGINASVVHDGSGYRLSLISSDTGSRNSIRILAQDNDGNSVDASGLSRLAYDPEQEAGSGKNLVQTQAAQDASLSINGLAITSDSNLIESALAGVTLNLSGTTSGSPVTITVKQELGSVRKSVDRFITEYNNLVQTVSKLTAFDPETGTRGPLLGDSTVRTIMSRIRTSLGESVQQLSPPYNSLVSLGISTDREGTLKLDESVFNKLLEEQPDTVKQLFATTGISSDTLVSYVNSSSELAPGIYSINVSRLATRGSLTTGSDSLTLPVTVTDGANTLVVRIDGVQSDQISLTPGIYTSGLELAAELENRINSDLAISGNESRVSARYVVDISGGHLEIESSRYGKESSVSIVSDNIPVLGLSGGIVTDGVDVEGTINGIAAEGSGQFLSGSGTAYGLTVRVEGGSTGPRGSIVYSSGMADRIGLLVNSYLGSNGIINNTTEGVKQRIDVIGEERERLSNRLELLEQRLRNQFVSLDTLLVQLQSTGDYLIQQLANMPVPGKK